MNEPIKRFVIDIQANACPNCQTGMPIRIRESSRTTHPLQQVLRCNNEKCGAIHDLVGWTKYA